MAGQGPEYGELDFTIARGISDPGVIKAVREVFLRTDTGEIKTNREMLTAHLSGDISLSKSEAEYLFTGLVLNDAATQIAGGKSFADYTFTVNVERAADVLETQQIACLVLDDVGFFNNDTTRPTVELTGTFPPMMDAQLPSEVQPLVGDLRRIFFSADTTVRVANPYFDPSPAVVGDIVGLLNRGVRAKILTRETESAASDLRSTLNRLHEEIDPSCRDHLYVRDLYKRDDQTGQQAYATHAKIAIADQNLCYLGSANLTDTSLSTNFELGVLLRGDVVSTAINVFDTVFEFSRRVDLPL